jgi:hypothetical protein
MLGYIYSPELKNSVKSKAYKKQPSLGPAAGPSRRKLCQTFLVFFLRKRLLFPVKTFLKLTASRL